MVILHQRTVRLGSVEAVNDKPGMIEQAPLEQLPEDFQDGSWPVGFVIPRADDSFGWSLLYHSWQGLHGHHGPNDRSNLMMSDKEREQERSMGKAGDDKWNLPLRSPEIRPELCDCRFLWPGEGEMADCVGATFSSTRKSDQASGQFDENLRVWGWEGSDLQTDNYDCVKIESSQWNTMEERSCADNLEDSIQLIDPRLDG